MTPWWDGARRFGPRSGRPPRKRVLTSSGRRSVGASAIHQAPLCPRAAASRPGLRRPQVRDQSRQPLGVEEQQLRGLVGNPPFHSQSFDRALDEDLALHIHGKQPQGNLVAPFHKSLVGAQAHDQIVDRVVEARLPRQDRGVGGCEGFIPEEPPVPVHAEDLRCTSRIRGRPPDPARLWRVRLAEQPQSLPKSANRSKGAAAARRTDHASRPHSTRRKLAPGE